MSYVIASPEMMTSAVTDLATIGSHLSAAHTAAALPSAAVIPAAADEVSASIAHLFSQYGGGFQALAGKAWVFHDQFVQNLKAAAHSYSSAEAANASLLRPLTAGVGAAAIATLQGSLTTLWNNLLTGFQNSLSNFVTEVGAVVLFILLIVLSKLTGIPISQLFI